jgi:hypothetical protein
MFDILSEVNRAKPGLVQLVAAGVGGVLVGGFLAGRFRKRPKGPDTRAMMEAARRATADRVAAVDRARSAAQEALDRQVGRGGLSAAVLGDRVPRLNHVARPSRSAMSSAVKLVPVVVGLLRNPIVRDLILHFLRSRRRR